MKKLINALIKLIPFLMAAFFLNNAYESVNKVDAETNQLSQEITGLEDNLHSIKTKNKKAMEFEKNLEMSKIRVKEVTDQIENVQKQLPNTIIDSEIVGYFLKVTESLSVKKMNITPLAEEARDFYFAKQYSLEGEGTFHQILVFFERMGSQERLLNTRSIQVTNSEQKNKGRFKILGLKASVEAFRYNAASQKEAPASSDPASATESASRKGLLDKIAQEVTEGASVKKEKEIE
ncbi:MAG: type 4a pilus biogenesis protein PilO [Oligoflexia bacterium]|nr:type 4a pilus biogenesis protein PilO [Oligoflexia bacterium]